MDQQAFLQVLMDGLAAVHYMLRTLLQRYMNATGGFAQDTKGTTLRVLHK